MKKNAAQVAYFMRPMGMEDIPTIARWFSNFDDIALFDRNLPVPVGQEAVFESWKPALEYTEPPRSLWFVAEDEDGNPAGVGGLQSINYIHGDAVLPMFIDRPARTNGLATGMTINLIDLAFGQLRLHRVSTFFRADHDATANVIAKVGFREEGRVREGWFAGGKHHDVVQVGLLRSEWQQGCEALREELKANSGIELRLEGIEA
ncbi:GNAT family N-acetyltransferase [Hoeflea sp.]|uniref:GNAT family N-acetyltransferase n=1 Tax=Hoeflea sp. TaxID=1940281 RepID=UPI003B026FA1